jgi:hypothetical protein
MRPYDRDYYVSTISVLQEQRRLIQSIADDMNMRLDELQEMYVMAADQEEDRNYDDLLHESWESGHAYAMWEEDKVVYDSSRKKECMCDACWNFPTDKYEHRMD